MLALPAALALAPAARADGGGARYAGPPAGGAPAGTTPLDQALPPAPPSTPPPAPPTATVTIAAGRAIPAPGTPRAVRRMIVAANRLVSKRYRWGGGHRDFARGLDSGYDCSGAVSYALYGARLLAGPLDSTGLARFGERGPGRWVTIYANRGHTYIVIAGVRFDTGGHDAFTAPRGSGPRWSLTPRSTRGLQVRHPAGL